MLKDSFKNYPILLIFFLISYLNVSCQINHSNQHKSVIQLNVINEIIQDLYNHIDSISILYKNDLNSIALIDIKEQDSSCVITIGTISYINSKKLIGYFYKDDLLIVVYSEGAKNCLIKILNKDNLIKSFPKGYPDEHSEEAFDPFEPWGYKLLLYEDKIKIISEGYF